MNEYKTVVVDAIEKEKLPLPMIINNHLVEKSNSNCATDDQVDYAKPCS